jgi:HYR domain
MSTKRVGVARILIVAVMAGAAFVACGGDQKPTAPTALEQSAAQNSIPLLPPSADSTTGADTLVGTPKGPGETTKITQSITTQAIPGPVPEDAIVRFAGLDWVWASPCSGGCSQPSPSFQPGFRFATADEFANKPDFHLFLNGSPDTANLCVYPACKCAAQWFDPFRTFCNPVDARAGFITSEPNGLSWESWYVRDVAVNNTPPTITAEIGVTRRQDAGTSNSSIATVNDAEDAETALGMTVNGLSSATANGVSVSNIVVNSAGQVTADVEAACAATAANFTLRVTDTGSLHAEATLAVAVTLENKPPVINPISNVVVMLPLGSSATSMPVTFPLPTATDNCSMPTVVTNPVSGAVFTVGATTVNVTATDAAGNTATRSFTVTISYNFAGFFSPVDSPPAVNGANAGQAIPVRFSLSGDKGLNIFAAGYPASVPIACPSGTPSTPIEETELAGSSGLSYNAATDQYQFVWRTEKAWSGTCRQLIVKLIDGSTYTANFQFR